MYFLMCSACKTNCLVQMVMCCSAVRRGRCWFSTGGDVWAGRGHEVQVHCGGRGTGRSHCIHVWFHVSHATHRVCHGSGWTHIQVRCEDLSCGVEWGELKWNVLAVCCRTLSQVWPTTGTPVLATFISGLAAAMAALLIQLEVLVEMMSIGKPETLCFLVQVMTRRMLVILYLVWRLLCSGRDLLIIKNYDMVPSPVVF